MIASQFRRLWMSLVVVGLLLALLTSAVPVQAADGGNGLRVSPVRNDLVINPGENKTVTLTVTNITAAPTSLQAVVNDFTAASDESGNPAIILDPRASNVNHGLKRFVQPINNFTLNPGQQKAVTVTIAVPKNTVGGGYYGAIRFAPANNGKEQGKNVSLASSVGSLIIVKVPGNVTEQLGVASFDVRHKDSASSFFTTNRDLTAVIRFRNSGNIQVAPFGKVLLKNRSGKVLQQYEINNVSPPGNVLPDSVRKFVVPLNKDKLSKFGQYKVEGNFGYGSNGQLLSASTTFYVIPRAAIIIFVAIVLLLVFVVLVLPRIVRAYNRWIISRAGRALGRSRK